MQLAFDPQISMTNYEDQADIGKENNNRSKALKEMCQDFESIFIYTMFKEMRDSVPDVGYIEQGSENEMFEDMMHMEIAKNMASQQGLGLGHSLYDELVDTGSEK